MLRFIFVVLFLLQFSIDLVNCDKYYVTVNTKCGPVLGVPQKTYLKNRSYISYKGIPYAQPPIGRLRFRVIFLS